MQHVNHTATASTTVGITKLALGWDTARGGPQNLCSHLSSTTMMPEQHQSCRVPVEVLASLYGLTLPKEEALPESYTMRRWLTRKIATIAGQHKQAWQATKSDPCKLLEHREGCRLRMQLSRARKRASQAAHQPS